MNKEEFEVKLQRRIAQLAVGASAIRNQGGSGLIDTCRNYFENSIDLKEFFSSLPEQGKYRKFIDKHTNAIVELFPEEAKSWGAARKGLNLFFRDVCYNKYLADKFILPTNFSDNNGSLKHLEVPLDNDVEKGLIRHFPNELPKWDGIKNLNPDKSDKYQKKAGELASKEKIAKIHLDLLFWRENNRK